MTAAVDRRPWLMEPCHVWQRLRDKHGYGLQRVQGKQVLAHRRAWEVANGPIPIGLCVLHHCDNPPCVNPTHLFLGTRADNMHDMVAKGRHWKTRTEACPSGHPYDEENTRVYRGMRYCRACQNTKGKRERRARGPVLPMPQLRTHCPHGHAYTPENTVLNVRGSRECRQCRRRRGLRRKASAS